MSIDYAKRVLLLASVLTKYKLYIMAQYIVIETFGGMENATIVTNPEDGTNRIFDTYEEALKEAEDCQDGIVFPPLDDFSQNRNVVRFEYGVEDVIRTAVNEGQLITPSEAKFAFEWLKNKNENFDDSTISYRIEGTIESQRNWTTSIDKKQMDDFNTIDDFIYFLYWVMKVERLEGGFHWETPFTDYVTHGIIGEGNTDTPVSTELYTTWQAVHRQAILDRLLDTLNSSDDVVVHTLCQMVADTWEHIDDDTAVDVLMGRYITPAPKCKVREDTPADQHPVTEENTPVEYNKNYDYRWIGDQEDTFQIFINGNWEVAQSIDFNFD